jgi:hypothetical protein
MAFILHHQRKWRSSSIISNNDVHPPSSAKMATRQLLFNFEHIPVKKDPTVSI